MKGRETKMFDGVEVRNFPVFRREEKTYPLYSAVVVEGIVEKIPEEIRSAVVIDYNKIPSSFFERERSDGSKKMNPSELKYAEDRLRKTIFGE